MESKQYNIAFGAFIRSGREMRGLYQSNVADKVGISQSHYAKIESGSRAASLLLAMKICDQLNLDINDFSSQYTKTP